MQVIARINIVSIAWMAAGLALAEAPPTIPDVLRLTPPESTSYRMERLCITSSGGKSSSAGYHSLVVLADGAVQGLAASCSSGMQAAIGLCTIAPDVSAPIVLTVNRDPGEPEEVILNWSGAEPSYEVFRSPSRIDVVQPANSLVVTSGCSADDAAVGDDLCSTE